ncbi:MAG: response regulator transcription factor [Thermoguttaceae bacterium]
MLIADDHQAVREGLVAMLRGTEFEVVAQAADCDQLVRYALTCNPDVVLTDLRMAGLNSLEAAEAIKTKQPTVRVVVFTMAESIPAMIRARNIGADGYILKDVARETLLESLRQIMQGKAGWSCKQLRQIGPARRRVYDADIFTGLTQRQAEVLDRIMCGLSNEKIAEDLAIDQETVKQYVKSLLSKLGVEDRTQAALWALRNMPLGS